MIKEIIEKYLEKTTVLERAAKELGDRSKYIGSSDIGNCPRCVYLLKKKEFIPTLQDLVKFARGHAFEPVIAEVFTLAGYRYVPQKEFVHPEYPYVQAHIDYFFHNKDFTKIRIVELKTVSTTPDSAYPNWIDQIQYQMGTVKIFYPDADIKGSVLVVNVATGDVSEFNGMEPIDSVYESLIQKAKDIMEALSKNEEPEPEIGLSCAWCPFRSSCPAFNGDEIELSKDVIEEIESYAELLEEKKRIERTIRQKRDSLVTLLGVGFKGKVNGYRISVNEVSTERLDIKRLKQEQPDIYHNYKSSSVYVKFDLRKSV